MPETEISQQLQRQVIDLQSRLAFQEDTLQKLSDIVAAQDAQIGALREQVKLLVEKLKDLAYDAQQGGGEPPQERPPHY